jgi:F-type H+-transporting ATPase subunit delta
MTSGSIAKRYARALFEIGEEQNSLLGLLKHIENVAALWNENEELRAAMTNPFVRFDTRKQIWSEVISRLGMPQAGRNFLNLLLDKSRIEELPAVARELGRLADRKQNRLRAEVVSAAPISDNSLMQLKSSLERLTGKVIVISKQEDPSLIGGIVTRVGDMMYDGSIKTQLDRLKEKMLGLD